MDKLPEVFADFARLGERPGLGLSVPLGREDVSPELAALKEGDRVLLIEWDNLCAEGTVKPIESDGYRYWFGILDGMAAIRTLEPREPTDQEREAGAARA